MSQDQLSFDTIKRHAAILVRLLKALRKDLPDVKSDQLWQAIRARWSEEELEKAVEEFKKNGNTVAFRKLFEMLPMPGSDGFFEADGKMWGTAGAWSQIFGGSPEYGTITTHLRQNGCTTRRERTFSGNVATFYKEDDVRRLCAGFLTSEPKAGPDGTFIEDGKRWGSDDAWLKIFDSPNLRSRITIARKIMAAKLLPRKGRNRKNRLSDFYEEFEVRAACADQLTDHLKVGPDGTIMVGKKRYGSIGAWTKIFVAEHPYAGICHRKVDKRVIGVSLKHRMARTQKNVPHEVYEETEVRRACEDLFETIPKADRDGTFTLGAERFATPPVWARSHGLIAMTVYARLKGYPRIRGKDQGGRTTPFFYAEADFRKACGDLLKRKRRLRKKS